MDELSYQQNSRQSGLYSVRTQNADEGGNALACSNHATSSQSLPDQERLKDALTARLVAMNTTRLSVHVRVHTIVGSFRAEL